MYVQRFEELSRQIEQAKTVAELCEIDEAISDIQGNIAEQVAEVTDKNKITNLQGLLRKQAKEVVETDQEIQETSKILMEQKSKDRFLKCLSPYKQQSEFFRFSLSLACATQNIEMTIRYFQYFELTSQKNIKDAVLAFSSQNSSEIVEYFNNFGLKDQLDIKDIALACAAKNVWGTIEGFQNFGLKDQSHIKDIAFICASKNVFATMMRFQNFGLKDQLDIKDIALVCAANDGKNTAEYFENLGVKSQDDIKDIALTCAAQNGEKTARNFKNFRLENQNDIKDIFIKCLEQNINAIQFVSNFFPEIADFQIPDSNEEYREDLNNYLHSNPQLIAPEYMKAILESGLSDVVQNLFITHGIRKKLTEKENLASKGTFNNEQPLDSVMGLFCDTTKFSENIFSVSGISTTKLQQIYFQCLNLQRIVHIPPFQNIEFSNDLFKEENSFKDIISYINLLYHYIASQLLPKEALKTYTQDTRKITKNNIKQEIELLKRNLICTSIDEWNKMLSVLYSITPDSQAQDIRNFSAPLIKILLCMSPHQNEESLYRDIEQAQSQGINIDLSNPTSTITSIMSFYAKRVDHFQDPQVQKREKDQNIKLINQKQKGLLEKKGIEINTDDTDRSLVLYFRAKGTREMDFAEFLISAWALNEYISFGKSKVFSKLKIVSRDSNVYPHFIHEICPDIEYYDVRGEKFKRTCSIYANAIHFTHGKLCENELYSRPIAAKGVRIDPTKTASSPDYIPLRLHYKCGAYYGNTKAIEEPDYSGSFVGVMSESIRALKELEESMLAEVND